MRNTVTSFFASGGIAIFIGAAAGPPPALDPRIDQIIDSVSARRIESDIRKLVSFGTRHTLSETRSETRGIGAARRWIEQELDRISAGCGGCLDVFFQSTVVKGEKGSRIPVDTEVVNVLAVLRGTSDSNRYLIMSGDIDSRVSDPLDAESD